MSATTQLTGEFEQPDSSASRWWTMGAALMMIIYELGWLVPWFQTMMGPSIQPVLWRSVLLLGGMMLLSYLAARAMEALHLLRQMQTIVLGVLLLVGVMFGELALWRSAGESFSRGLINLSLGIPAIAIYVIFTWYRGFTLAYDGVRPLVVWKRFRFGLLAMLAYLYFVVRWGFPAFGLGYTMLFLFFGLFGLILTRIGFVNLVQGRQKNPFDRRWSFSVAGALGLVILISGLLSSLITGQFVWVLDLARQFAQFIIIAVLFILNIPALIAAFVLWPLLETINAYLLSHPGNFEYVEMLDLDLYGSFMDRPIRETPLIVYQLTALCFWGALAVLAMVMMFRARRAWLASRQGASGSPEGILGQGEARRLLRQSLQDAWEGVLNRLRPAQRHLAAARVRRIYQELMDVCIARNTPRPPARTPLEFLPDLAQVFPANRDDLAVITQAYVRVRYGEYPESREEVDAVEAAWARVSQAAKEATEKNTRQSASPGS